jgi:hypothetical protein
MSIKIFDEQEVPEQNDAEYEAYFVGSDASEAALVPAAILSITVSLIDVLTDTVIKDNVDVLNANGGSLDVDGRFVLVLSPSDHLIYGTSPKSLYKRRLTLKVAYVKTGGYEGGINREIIYYVRSMADVI